MPLAAGGLAGPYGNGLAVGDMVRTYLSSGVRSLDGAAMYGSQSLVGDALQSHVRSNYFMISKVSCSAAKEGDAEACATETALAIRENIAALRVRYLDLLLVHFPPMGGERAGHCQSAVQCNMVRAQWSAVEGALRDGVTRAIGVANFGQGCLACLLRTATIAPAVAQIPPGWALDANVTDICRQNSIVRMVFSSLKVTRANDKAILTRIAGRLGTSEFQVALRYFVQQGMAVAWKSSNADHVRSNLNVFNWRIKKGDMEKIEGILREATGVGRATG